MNETSALNYKVIEHISPTINQLLVDINGSSVLTSGGEVLINTIEAKKIYYTPSIGILLMKFFSNFCSFGWGKGLVFGL